ncbi:MAG: nucleoside hydrolase-like domain-containing protein [Planctomycetota bacterium]
MQWIEDDIDRYASFYDTLKTHAPGFPTPAELKARTFVGNIRQVGAMDKDTPGSDRIVEVLLDDKPGPVYLQAWGGTNTIARALWTIQHEHPDQMERVARKAILYIILDQDKTFRHYIQPHWPDLQVLGSFRQFATIAYGWNKKIPADLHKHFDKVWMQDHILEGHGPLCARYEAHPKKGFRSEGDSPSFMHQIDVGLRSLEHPGYGGWGGRFVREEGTKSVWRGARDDGDLSKPIWRWAEAFQNDWAARADWCVQPVAEANHPPVAKVAGPLDRTVKPGETVTLSAEGSTDPDGDKLTYRWWHYNDVDTAPSTLAIADATSATGARFVVPDEPGKTLHVILEVTDAGEPPLTRYRRLIVTIGE